MKKAANWYRLFDLAPKVPLPYVRDVEYLSPSSLRLLEEDPTTFYLRRLGPESCRPAEEQGYPSSVGCAFDAIAKSMLAWACRLPCPPLVKLLENVKTERQRAIQTGWKLFSAYATSGACDALMRDKPRALEVSSKPRCAPGTDVPIKGFLDATLKIGRKAVVVHDWKTTGANRPGECSPHQGYVRIWDSRKPGMPGPAHKKAGCKLEEIDENWATQLTIYGWLIGHPVKEREASVDELVIQEGDHVRVAQFRTKIGLKFQKQVLVRLKNAWARIKEKRVVPEGHSLEIVRAS